MCARQPSKVQGKACLDDIASYRLSLQNSSQKDVSVGLTSLGASRLGGVVSQRPQVVGLTG